MALSGGIQVCEEAGVVRRSSECGSDIDVDPLLLRSALIRVHARVQLRQMGSIERLRIECGPRRGDGRYSLDSR